MLSLDMAYTELRQMLYMSYKEYDVSIYGVYRVVIWGI